MTYNIRHGCGNDDRVDLERIAGVIRSINPDIVTLQEVDRFWPRSGNVDQPAELARMLEMHACFAANLELAPNSTGDRLREYGVLILSKAPIRWWNHSRFPETSGWEPRGLLEARIDHPITGEIAVLATHFQAGPACGEDEARRQRSEQARLTAERIRVMQCPVLLMGDLNAGPGDSEVASLFRQSGLRDAWAVAGGGNGFTFPASPFETARSRIDYALVADEFTVESVTVVDNAVTRMASDHFPVIADLRLAPNPGLAT
jgi:endonuclease/exonuclease/phosphatase family metal-dependent hydrolase